MAQVEADWSVHTDSAAATQQLAARIAADLQPGTVLALVGELGAGKTCFVQGLARGLGVYNLADVLSPTYTLVNEYPGERATLVHVDFYRLDEADAVRALGIEEQLYRKDAVVAIEWGDKLPELLPPGTVWLRFSADDGGRRIAVQGLLKEASAPTD